MYFQSPLDYHIKRKLHHDATNDGNNVWCALIFISTFLLSFNLLQCPSWSWSYGSWIYNYMCYLCLSLLKLWVQTSRCTRYNIMWNKCVSDLWQVGGFLWVHGFPPPIKLTATISLVESDVKHIKPSQTKPPFYTG
jgi:hypothetical protein